VHFPLSLTPAHDAIRKPGGAAAVAAEQAGVDSVSSEPSAAQLQAAQHDVQAARLKLGGDSPFNADTSSTLTAAASAHTADEAAFNQRKSAGSGSWTRLTFKPDLARFKVKSFEKDFVALLTRRVYDIAACVGEEGISVTLNGQVVPVHSFQEYVALYPSASNVVHGRINSNWQVAVGAVSSETSDSSSGPPRVAFINSINTTRGGTHVKCIEDQITRHVAEHVNKLHKDLNVLPLHVRPHLALFINGLVQNPSFDSQTKDTLITPVEDFGSSCDLRAEFLKTVIRDTGIVESVVEWATSRQRSELIKQSRPARGSGKRLMIPKLDDANDAGGPNSAECTLILTEGDSAKALAVAGLSVIGRDK